MGEVEDAHAVECLAVLAERLARRFRMAVARLFCNEPPDLPGFRGCLLGNLLRRLLHGLGRRRPPLGHGQLLRNISFETIPGRRCITACGTAPGVTLRVMSCESCSAG